MASFYRFLTILIISCQFLTILMPFYHFLSILTILVVFGNFGWVLTISDSVFNSSSNYDLMPCVYRRLRIAYISFITLLQFITLTVLYEQLRSVWGSFAEVATMWLSLAAYRAALAFWKLEACTWFSLSSVLVEGAWRKHLHNLRSKAATKTSQRWKEPHQASSEWIFWNFGQQNTLPYLWCISSVLRILDT